VRSPSSSPGVVDLASVPALHDADGAVAEECAFPVAPTGEWRRPGPEGLRRGSQPSGGGSDGTLRPDDAPGPRALPPVLAGTRSRRLLATRPPSRAARWFGNITPVRAQRRCRHPPPAPSPDKPTPPTMRSPSLGTGTDRFQRPGERWRQSVSRPVGRRPTLPLTGIRHETSHGPPDESGPASSGSRSISPRSSGIVSLADTDRLEDPLMAISISGCSRRRGLTSPRPPPSRCGRGRGRQRYAVTLRNAPHDVCPSPNLRRICRPY